MTRYSKLIVGALTAVAACFAGLAGVRLGIEPVWLAMAGAGLPICIYLAARYPILLLVALLFVGNYKTRPAEGISFSDPTLLLAFLTAGAAVWQLLLIISGAGRKSVRELFMGQGRGCLAFVVFLGIFALSSLYSSAPAEANDKLMKFAVFETLAFFSPFLFLRDERDFRLLTWGWVVLALPIAIRVTTGIAHPSEQQMRGIADVTQIGDAALMCCALLILLYYRLPGRLGRSMRIVALPVLVVGLIASIARGPTIMLLATIVGSLFVLPRQGMAKRASMLIGAILVVAGMTVAYLWVQQLPGAERKAPMKEAELSALLHGNADPGGTTSRRLDFFRSSLGAMANHPLTGVGLAGWSNYYYGAYSGPDRAAYPHNFILEVAAEQGIPGLAALLTLLGAMIAALRRVRSAHSEFSFVLPVVMFSILLNAITGNIEDRVFFFWLSASFVAARFTLRERESLEEAPEYEYSARRFA